MTHAYAVGEMVTLEENTMTRHATGSFVVTGLVPVEDGRQPRYRVKSDLERFERVVMESDCAAGIAADDASLITKAAFK